MLPEIYDDVKELILAAVEARRNAYCPYSKFQVGSAFRIKTGEIVTGCNVENLSLGNTVCAERMTICKAISDGFKEFIACAVVAYQEHSFTTPCGVCRQFMAEFGEQDYPIYSTKPTLDKVLVSSIHELLPRGFFGNFSA